MWTCFEGLKMCEVTSSVILSFGVFSYHNTIRELNHGFLNTVMCPNSTGPWIIPPNPRQSGSPLGSLLTQNLWYKIGCMHCTTKIQQSLYTLLRWVCRGPSNLSSGTIMPGPGTETSGTWASQVKLAVPSPLQWWADQMLIWTVAEAAHQSWQRHCSCSCGHACKWTQLWRWPLAIASPVYPPAPPMLPTATSQTCYWSIPHQF